MAACVYQVTAARLSSDGRDTTGRIRPHFCIDNNGISLQNSRVGDEHILDLNMAQRSPLLLIKGFTIITIRRNF